MRLLKVRMLDVTVKSLMVDDSQVVANLMVLICTKIGITNHDEYSLVWDKPEENQENIPTNKFGTLGGTMTLRKPKYKEGEKEIDPKMEELKRQLNTEDGGEKAYVETSNVWHSSLGTVIRVTSIGPIGPLACFWEQKNVWLGQISS